MFRLVKSSIFWPVNEDKNDLDWVGSPTYKLTVYFPILKEPIAKTSTAHYQQPFICTIYHRCVLQSLGIVLLQLNSADCLEER
jgi:hypothetical protein